MNCRECKARLDDVILGPEGDPLARAPGDVQSHLDQCASCRRDFEGMKEIGGCFAAVEKLAEELPEELVERSRKRILAAVEERKAEVPWPRSPVELWSHVFGHIPGWAWGMGLAAAVVIIYGTVILVMELKPGAEERVAVSSRREVVQPPARGRTIEPPAPEGTLASLTEEFEKLKAGDPGLDKDFLNKLVNFTVNEAQGVDERLAANKLLADTYEQVGERDLARIAFGRYLDDVEKRDGVRQAAIEAGLKAHEIFYGQRDYLTALGYYDMILTRYPGLEQGEHARFMVGMYYQVQKLWPEALKAYRKVVEEIPDSHWAKRARQEIWVALSNMDRRQEAIEELKQFAQDYPDEEDAGYAHFQIGCLKHVMGEAYYPEALEEFKLLVNKYPNHRYAHAARKMVAMINRMTVGDVLLE